jgi:sterol 14-demethylase
MEALNKMDKLHRCVKEALRMYPPLLFVMRKVIKPFTYKDHYVPEGKCPYRRSWRVCVCVVFSPTVAISWFWFPSLTACVPLIGDTLFVSPALSMRVEEVFPNADQYNPERFVEEDKQTQKYRYLGFGAGRHGCMGENFAYLQIKTIWSVLLRNFDIELVGELPKPDYTAMVVGMQLPSSFS